MEPLTRQTIEFHGAWSTLLGDYTSRDMSVKEDVLPALAGIAQAFGRSIKCDYYAGIWAISTLRVLSWNCTASGTRSKQYRAPSWSWASIEGTIDHNEMYRIGFDSPCCRIESCQTFPKITDQPYGQVLGGTLVLRAWRKHLTRHEVSSLLQSPAMSFDCDENEDAGGPLDAICLFRWHWGRTHFLCLLLRRLLPSLWCRVGLLEYDTPDLGGDMGMFEGMGDDDLERITII